MLWLSVDNDPHFMVMIDGISDGICFDIDGNLGDVFQLIYDPVNGKLRTWNISYEKIFHHQIVSDDAGLGS